MRWAADRFLPGYGTAAAITLGLATVVMTFAARVLLARDLGRPRLRGVLRADEGEGWPAALGVVPLAGLLAGLAVTFEFQTGLVGVVLLGYALTRKTLAPAPLA